MPQRNYRNSANGNDDRVEQSPATRGEFVVWTVVWTVVHTNRYAWIKIHATGHCTGSLRTLWFELSPM